MRSLNLDQLRTLIAIDDLGTLAAAARALHLSPPTISLQLAELEARLDVALVHRGRRQAMLTPAGSSLADDGRRLLKSADDATARARRIAAGFAGQVRLGTSAGVVARLLPPYLAALAAQRPGIDIALDVMESREAMRRLQAGALDLAIVALPQAVGPPWQVRAWRSDPMAAFLPPQWKVPNIVTPLWLARHPWIASDPRTSMHRLTGAWFAAAGLYPLARATLDFPVAIKELVAAGYGAAVLPKDPEPRADDRWQVRPLRPALVRHMGLAHRIDALEDGAIREVLRILTRPPASAAS